MKRAHRFACVLSWLGCIGCVGSSGRLEHGVVRPVESEILVTGSRVLTALPEGRILVASDGETVVIDPDRPDRAPVVLDRESSVGDVRAVVEQGDALLFLTTGGAFVLRDGVWVPSPFLDDLGDGAVRAAVQLAPMLGRGEDEFWIATQTMLWRVANGDAVPLPLERDLEGVELAFVRRLGGAALWVRFSDRVLELWFDRDGTVGSASVLLPSAPEALAGDADLNAWIVLEGRLHSVGRDRRLVDHGLRVARILASPRANEVWVLDDDGGTWLFADGRLMAVPDLQLDPKAAMAVAADGSLYVSDRGVRRYLPRHAVRMTGLSEGAILAAPRTVRIEAPGDPRVEVRIDGEPMAIQLDPWRVTIDPEAWEPGPHELVVQVVYDDGTLPTTIRRAFEVVPRVTWSDDVRPLHEEHCAMCHGPSGSATTRLADRDDWESRIDTILENVERGRMPLGRPPLSRADVAMIRAWKFGGFRE